MRFFVLFLVGRPDCGNRVPSGIRFRLSTFSQFLYQHGQVLVQTQLCTSTWSPLTKTEKKTRNEVEFRNPKGHRFPQSAGTIPSMGGFPVVFPSFSTIIKERHTRLQVLNSVSSCITLSDWSSRRDTCTPPLTSYQGVWEREELTNVIGYLC